MHYNIFNKIIFKKIAQHANYVIVFLVCTSHYAQGDAMALQPISPLHTIKQTQDELILVVKKEDLFGVHIFQGFKQTDLQHYLKIINERKKFLPRSLMEHDFNYKQIIPYLIFEHENKFFLMQRSAKASESRLKNKYTLGIGGHVRQEDLDEGQTLFDWAQREFNEEVFYPGNLTVKSLGIINDDSNDVGKVHAGFVLLLQGDSPHIKIKSELKNGTLLPLEECKTFYPHMESWSQMVFTYLQET